MNKNIFERNIGDRICYSLDAQSRIRDIKHCDDIEALRLTLHEGIYQKTVIQAINSRIKKLDYLNEIEREDPTEEETKGYYADIEHDKRKEGRMGN